MKTLNLERIIELDNSGNSLKEIAIEFDTCYQNIQRFLKKNNYCRVSNRHRTYKVVDNYFEDINSETKAYLLGFFAADGGILKDNRIMICLAETDRQIVELFSKELSLNKPIEINDNQTGVKFRQKQFQIRFKSHRMLKDLKVFGIEYRKSLNEMSFLGKIPKQLEHHFIRGYFDGDGCISTNSTRKTPSYLCTITNSTRGILEEFSKVFTTLGIKHKIYSATNKSIYYTLYTTSTRYSCLLGEYLYKESTIFLQRKKDKFDKANTVLTYLNNISK